MYRSSCRYRELRGINFSSTVSTPLSHDVRLADEIEMLTITPTSTRTYNTINQALLSAEKLAAEWDRRQVFDLHSIRRQGGSQTSGKKKGQKRPRSVGVNIGRSDRMRDPRGMIEV
jgi:hypothetical protein